jgi:hypothetical protein
MAVVRIDDKLLGQLKEELRKDENKYKYGSLSSLINSIIHKEMIRGQNGNKK